ncbi:hypothetical protein [Myroides odoratus]|uniref:hypothetical protein n=1 Tax=Myroides odoratus TaxID=256 RepID=UPI00334265C1
MKKKVMILSLVLCFITLLTGCSTEDTSRNSITTEQKEINTINISKKWIVTHFVFSAACKPGDRLPYQLSSIHLNLKEGRYSAVDAYSLKEDTGIWEIKNGVVHLISDQGLVHLKIRINKLSNNEMEAEVLEHEDIIGVELISER